MQTNEHEGDILVHSVHAATIMLFIELFIYAGHLKDQ